MNRAKLIDTSVDELIHAINDATLDQYGNYFKLYHLDTPVLSFVPCIDFNIKAPMAILRIAGGIHLVNVVIPQWVKVDRNNAHTWELITNAIRNKLLQFEIDTVVVSRRGGRISHWDDTYIFGLAQTPILQLVAKDNGGPAVCVANRCLWVEALVESDADYIYSLGESIAQYIFYRSEKPKPASPSATVHRNSIATLA